MRRRCRCQTCLELNEKQDLIDEIEHLQLVIQDLEMQLRDPS